MCAAVPSYTRLLDPSTAASHGLPPSLSCSTAAASSVEPHPELHVIVCPSHLQPWPTQASRVAPSCDLVCTSGAAARQGPATVNPPTIKRIRAVAAGSGAGEERGALGIRPGFFGEKSHTFQPEVTEQGSWEVGR